MKTYKKILILFWHQLRTSFSRKRVIAGYLVGMIYYHFLGKHTANFAEAFIQHFATVGDVTVMLLGFILALSDAPFIQTDSFMMIHRSGRKHWYDAMWIYIIVQAVIYYGCSFLICMFCTISKLSECLEPGTDQLCGFFEFPFSDFCPERNAAE